MRMNERMDEGDILLQRADADRRRGDLRRAAERLAELGAAALMDALDGADAGTLHAGAAGSCGARRWRR